MAPRFLFTPEPARDERAALVKALGEARSSAPAAYGSAWRRAGLLENAPGLGSRPAEEARGDAGIVEP
jgi:hypothetical protein